VSATDVKLAGTMPFRTQDLPVSFKGGCIGSNCAFNGTVDSATNGDGSCPGGTMASLPLSIDIGIDTTQGDSLQINSIFDSTNTGQSLSNDLAFCGGNLAGVNVSLLKGLVLNSMSPTLLQGLASQIEAQICATTALGACPAGTAADGNGICRYSGPTQPCAPSPALFRSGC
jgi:hypothetical protein